MAGFCSCQLVEVRFNLRRRRLFEGSLLGEERAILTFFALGVEHLPLGMIAAASLGLLYFRLVWRLLKTWMLSLVGKVI